MDRPPSSTCIAAATVAASSRMNVPRMMAPAWNSADWPARASRDVIELASMTRGDSLSVG